MRKIVQTFCLSMFAGSALAANINIGPNGCTLADAITAANVNAPAGNCAAGSGSDFIIAPDEWVVTLQSDLPTIVSDMTIRSASTAGKFYILGNDERRVLRITGSNTEVTLRRVHVGGGNTGTSDGAGIRVENATVRLEDSVVISNHARNAPCDGIYVTGGDLTLLRTRIEANPGIGVCGTNASVHVVESEFTRNSSIDFGTGLSVSSGDLLVERSLFDEFSGIRGNQSVVEINNSTFSYLDGQGYVTSAFQFSNLSVVTINHVTSTLPFEAYDSILSISNSFLSRCDLFTTNLLLNTGNSSRLGNCLDNFGIGSTLLPLADNGGPTRTRAIALASSEAINGGNPAYCQALDQRGESRGASCDIGAYEATGFADVSVTARTEPSAPYVSSQSVTYFAEIENKGPGTATNVRIAIAASNAFITNVNSPFCSAIPCVVSSIQPGQTLTIPIEVTFGNYTSGPFSIGLSAHTTATSTYTDANEDNPTGNNFANLAGPVNPGADMAVTMSLLSGGPYFMGQTIQYEALVQNYGPQTATAVQLVFAPDNLVNVTFTGCTSVVGQICNVANIGSGGSRTISVQAKIDDAQFDAIASVSASQVDIDSSNNLDDRNNGGGVSVADIAVGASIVEAAPYYSDQYMRFQLTIATASQPASNIRLDFDFPGAGFIDIQGCSDFPCLIPQLAANSRIDLLAQFFAPLAVPGVVDTLNFRVWAAPGQQDPDLSNNEVVIVRTLLPTADIAAQLALLSPPPYLAGQEIEYSLRVVNVGINAANNVVANAIPQNLTLVSAFGTLCQNPSCTIPRLNLYDEENMALVYRINTAGAFNLTATANANEFDSIPGNNTDSTNNGGFATEPTSGDILFADGFE